MASASSGNDETSHNTTMDTQNMIPLIVSSPKSSVSLESKSEEAENQNIQVPQGLASTAQHTQAERHDLYTDLQKMDTSPSLPMTIPQTCISHQKAAVLHQARFSSKEASDDSTAKRSKHRKSVSFAKAIESRYWYTVNEPPENPASTSGNVEATGEVSSMEPVVIPTFLKNGPFTKTMEALMDEIVQADIREDVSGDEKFVELLSLLHLAWYVEIQQGRSTSASLNISSP
jgi:hypothetical protein